MKINLNFVPLLVLHKLVNNVFVLIALWVFSCIFIGLASKIAWMLVTFGWGLV